VSVKRRRSATPAPELIDLPLTPVAEETPFFRPKTRARARAARRGRLSRATLALQIGGGCVLSVAAVWAVYAQLTTSAWLRVAHVEVRGNSRLSVGEVRELLGPAIGENILRLDIERLNEHLAASPWVATARVRRTLPNTLEIQVHERVPLALAELDRLYLMDNEGSLIDIYGPRTAGFDLPVVRGLKGLDSEARAGRAARAGALLDDLDDLAAEISEVEVEDSGDLRAVLRGGGEIVRLGSPPYRSRFTTFLQLRKELTRRCPNAEYFDLRFRSRIVAVEPAAPGGTLAAQAGTTEVIRY
jgi:cell division protein FtsQ